MCGGTAPDHYGHSARGDVTNIYRPMKLRVFVDDITALWMGEKQRSGWNGKEGTGKTAARKRLCWCADVGVYVVYNLSHVKTERTHTPAQLDIKVFFAHPLLYLTSLLLRIHKVHPESWEDQAPDYSPECLRCTHLTLIKATADWLCLALVRLHFSFLLSVVIIGPESVVRISSQVLLYAILQDVS